MIALSFLPDMKILLTDGLALFRAGIRELLLQNESLAVSVVDSNSVDEAEQLAEQHGDIDITIILMTNAHISYEQYLEHVATLSQCCLVLVVSSIEESRLIRQIVSAGARGYIAGSQSSEVFIAAIQLILSGGIYLPHFLISNKESSPAASEISYSSIIISNTPLGGRINYLTARQKQVLSLLSSGASNKEIGLQLELSAATIRTHIAAIFKILNVHNRTQASRIAMENGLLQSMY